MNKHSRVIKECIDRVGANMSQLSKALGHNASYLQQHFTRNSPRELRYEDRVKLAQMLGIPVDEVGGFGLSRVFNRIELPSVPGLDEGDAAPYDPPQSAPIVIHEGQGLFIMKSKALDEHSPPIWPGDILICSLKPEHVNTVTTGKVVVAQLYDRGELLKATTIVRVFLAPNKLVTNSSVENTIIRIGDPAAPYEVAIKAVAVNIVHNLLTS